MFLARELKILTHSDPERANVNPWDPTSQIKCMEIVERFHDCVANMRERNAIQLQRKCVQLRKIAYLCFKLEPKYFLEEATKELDSEAYLDLYLKKQLGRDEEQDRVWKLRDLGS